jgi:REP element-mobilizing transposase RayT
MDRYWLLTWRTYGSWLPGDERGFVDPILDAAGNRVIHNLPGTPIDRDNPHLRRYAREVMRGEPIRLQPEQGEELLNQFQETARHRGWKLLAVAIMANHIHLIVGVPGDPDPATLLRDFKSYGSRRLNRKWGNPMNGSWWAESGSRRLLKAEENVQGARRYVLQEQPNPLLTWEPVNGIEEQVRSWTPHQPANAGRSPGQPADAGL